MARVRFPFGHFPAPVPHSGSFGYSGASFSDAMRWFWRVREWLVSASFSANMTFTFLDGASYVLALAGGAATTLTRLVPAPAGTSIDETWLATRRHYFRLNGTATGVCTATVTRSDGGAIDTSRSYPKAIDPYCALASLQFLGPAFDTDVPWMAMSGGMYYPRVSGVYFSCGCTISNREGTLDFEWGGAEIDLGGPGPSVSTVSTIESATTPTRDSPMVFNFAAPTGTPHTFGSVGPVNLQFTPSLYYAYANSRGVPFFDETTGARL